MNEPLSTIKRIVLLLFILVAFVRPYNSYANPLPAVSLPVDKSVEACLDDDSSLSVCSGLRTIARKGDNVQAAALAKLKSFAGTPGVLLGAAAKLLLFDHSLRVHNPLSFGHTSEIHLSSSELKISIKWIF